MILIKNNFRRLHFLEFASLPPPPVSKAERLPATDREKDQKRGSEVAISALLCTGGGGGGFESNNYTIGRGDSVTRAALFIMDRMRGWERVRDFLN
jgi:hypothetical protein